MTIFVTASDILCSVMVNALDEPVNDKGFQGRRSGATAQTRSVKEYDKISRYINLKIETEKNVVPLNYDSASNSGITG